MPERQVAEVIESPSVIELPGFINIGRINDDFYLPVVFENQYSESVGLGTGGYGTVIGLVMINGRHLAVKRFNQAFQTSKRAQRCFRELQLLKALDHENIVKMKFLYTTDKTMESLNSVYLTTEYCGENLLHILLQETEENHFTLISIKKMVSELLRAIKYLNSAKIMHRDLKPDNLAIDANGKLTLLDFGLARVINENLQHTNDPGTAYFRAIETIEFDTTKDDINEKKKTYDEKAGSLSPAFSERVPGVERRSPPFFCSSIRCQLCFASKENLVNEEGCRECCPTFKHRSLPGWFKDFPPRR